jgi:hypothetical protein
LNNSTELPDDRTGEPSKEAHVTEPWHQGFVGLVNVRYWHKADITIVLNLSCARASHQVAQLSSPDFQEPFPDSPDF